MPDDTALPEIWREIPGFEGYYEVSDHGRVRTLERRVACAYGATRRLRSRLLTCSANRSDGRMTVALSKHGAGRPMLVAALILAAFRGPRPPGLWALHNNGDHTDDRLENLRWGTPSENNLDQQRHGTCEKRNRTHCPRMHRLVEPNLVPARLRVGLRNCLTCARIKSRHHHHAIKHGRLYDLDAEMAKFYATIMGLPAA